jgi:hypothetical protein
MPYNNAGHCAPLLAAEQKNALNIKILLADPTRFERVTFAFGGLRIGHFCCLPVFSFSY